MKCEWRNVTGSGGEPPCEEEGIVLLPGSYYYYPWDDTKLALCAKHHKAVLAMGCCVWLDDADHEPGHDRSGECGVTPVVGFVVWKCEPGVHEPPSDDEIEEYEKLVGHTYEDELDDDCYIWGCAGYELKPACKHCLADPNENDKATRRAEQSGIDSRSTSWEAL